MSATLFSEDSNQPGMLVTIDGPNGSGKTYLTCAVAAKLRETGVTVHSTRQPSASSLGELARSSEAFVRGRGLACLVAADRHDQLEREIAAHLRAGEIVLCDRYVESSLVLQRLDEVEIDFIVAINAGIARPDLRVRLRADPEVISARLAARTPDPGRRFEQSTGPERELELYEEADLLLERDYGLGAALFDTTDTNTEALGVEVADLIAQRRAADG